MAKAAQPLVISYIRFSTLGQQDGDSKRRQLEKTERWCAEHGYQLAERLEGLGVSAFRGKHTKEGDLAIFLRLVEAGKVAKGTILIVEELDRLSRQSPEESVGLFLSIIRHGITIVTLNDGFIYKTGELDMTRLVISTVKLCLANLESEKKSERVGAAWAQKRKEIGNKPLTKTVPSWLELKGDEFVVKERGAAAIREMFSLTLKGWGNGRIVAYINEKYQHWNGKRRPRTRERSTLVQRSYIEKTLKNRAVIGEFQPMTSRWDGNVRTRVPAGPPIPDYYPAIIDEKTFLAVQSIRRARCVKGGPQHKFVNIFSGLLKTIEGENWVIVDKGCGKRYVPANAFNYKMGHSIYLPVPPFEFAMTMRLFEGDIATVEQKIDVESLKGKLAEIDTKVKAVEDEAATRDTPMGAVVGLLGKLSSQKAQIQQEIEAAEAKSRRPVPRNSVEMARKLLAGTLSAEQRLELRQWYQSIVREIRLYGEREGTDCIYSTMIFLNDDREIEFAFRADYRRKCERDKAGHMIKGKKQISSWAVTFLVPQDGEDYDNASAKAPIGAAGSHQVGPAIL